MIQFTPKQDQPVSGIREEVFAGSVKIGEVWQFHGGGFQSQVHFGPLAENYRVISLGGFGSTREEAVKAAIANGKDHIQAIERAVSFLTEHVGGE